MLTVYGIETNEPTLKQNRYILRVATVLTVYGIETFLKFSNKFCIVQVLVATVLTVYGIETAFLEMN